MGKKPNTDVPDVAGEMPDDEDVAVGSTDVTATAEVDTTVDATVTTDTTAEPDTAAILEQGKQAEAAAQPVATTPVPVKNVQSFSKVTALCANEFHAGVISQAFREWAMYHKKVLVVKQDTAQITITGDVDDTFLRYLVRYGAIKHYDVE